MEGEAVVDGKVRDLLVHVVRRINGMSLSHCAEDQIRAVFADTWYAAHPGFLLRKGSRACRGSGKQERWREGSQHCPAVNTKAGSPFELPASVVLWPFTTESGCPLSVV